MLSYLLDAHISPGVAEESRRQRPEIPIYHLGDQAWRAYRHEADVAILLKAASDGLTLVTADVATIPGVLRSWWELEVPFGGVVFVPAWILQRSHIGRLVQGLHRLWDHHAQEDWTSRVEFLRP